MKRKILYCILVSIMFLGLISCNKSTTNINNNISTNTNINNVEVEQSSEVSFEDISYYYKAYMYIQDFYKGFYFIGDSIEDVDKQLFNTYLSIMNEASLNIEKMEVPNKYVDIHEYLINATKEYSDGINKLFISYEEANVKNYLEASDILLNAESTLEAYVNLIYKDFENISTLFTSLLQNEYYMDLIEFYSYEETFTENENDSLFSLERLIKKFANLKNDLLTSVCNKDSISTSKKALEDNLKEIKNLSIENEHLKEYRDNIVIQIEEYVKIILELSEIMEKDFDDEKILNLISRSDELNYNIYLCLKPISEFYNSYDINIGFDEALKNIENMLDNIENNEESEDNTIKDSLEIIQ